MATIKFHDKNTDDKESMKEQKKLLAVDDDDLVLKTIHALLSKFNWHVETCNNPLDALRRINDEKYDCVLLDIRMPQISGTEVLKRIRKLEEESRISAQQVVFLTGYADEEARQKAFEFGAFGYLYKPFEAANLIEMLDRCVKAKAILKKTSTQSLDFILSKPDVASLSPEQEWITFDQIGAQVNKVSPEELFWWYAKTGFFYPSKKRKLTPYLPLVESCWKKALQLGEDVFWIATVSDEKNNSWASICNWRTTWSGWVSQHLIGTGHAAYPLMLMLGTQAKVIDESKIKPYEAFQNWYRPTNKYANKVFGLLGASIDKSARCVVEFSYFLVGKKAVDSALCASNVQVEICTNKNSSSVKEYLQKHRNQVYVSAEEYLSADIELESLNQIYKKVGLERKRRFYLAFQKDTPIGVLIVHRGPFGINFSLLENACELILNEGLDMAVQQSACLQLLQKAFKDYEDFDAPYIPLVTESKNVDVLKVCGSKPVRTYDKFIWLKSAYYDWYKTLFDISSPAIKRWKKIF